MIDLGSELRQAREAKGISLAEAEEAIRIRQRYLQALEGNDWAALPTQVQTRGFLRNYAIYLGLDEDEVMSQFGQLMRGPAVSLPPPPASETSVRTATQDGSVFNPRNIDIERMVGMPAWLSSDIVVGVALALIVAFVGFGLVRFVFGNSGESSAAPTATSASTPALTPVFTPALINGALQQPSVEAGSLPDAATPASVTPTFDASTGSVQLTLEAIEHVWVRVTVDGVNVREGILEPGAPETWQGAQQIVLETANGAGLKALVNGQPFEDLGQRGQPITLAWGPSGPATPVPTSAP
jgi:cytoskeletal protein RodZ